MSPVRRRRAAGGREGWLDAGQELLRQGGPTAVKLAALTAATRLTTGSFYHHFAHMQDYMDALAGHYGSDLPPALAELRADPDPRARLRAVFGLFLDARIQPLDAAMREWAASNAIAAESVEAADAVMLRFLERTFRDLGLTTADARVRAQLFFAAGVARMTPPWKLSPKILDDVLAVLAPHPPS